MADSVGLVYFVLRVLPDLAFEFVNGGMRTRLLSRLPNRTAAAEELLERIHPDSAENLAALMAMEPGRSAWVDLKWRHVSGQLVYSRGWVKSRARADGSVVLEGAMQDVSPLRRVETELRHSEEVHRLLSENAWDVIWTMALDGSITYVSPAVERVRGITAEEAMAQTPDQINPPASAAVVSDYFGRLFAAINDGSPPPEFRGELDYYRRDGSIMTGDLQVIPHVNADGEVVQILGVTRDVSDRKLAEVAEARYRRLMDNSFVATNLLTPDGRFLLVNQAMCQLVGYDAEALLSMTWGDLTTVDDLARNLAAVAELAAGQRDSYRATERYIHSDGHLIWGDLSLSCIRGEGGEAEHLVAQIVDITEEVESKHRLAEREQQNRALADRLRAELDSAASYVASILPGDLAGPVQVSSRYLPSQEVGGDCFNYTWIDDDHLIVYLIDVSGHGVEPALVSVSVHNMLRSGSLSKETLLAPDQVLTELNRRFQMNRQGGHYFTIWYGVYQASSRELRYAGAGHPPALVLTAGSPTRLISQSPPIGVFGDTEFTADTVAVPTGSQILIYSDGAFELLLPDGGWWSLEDFAAFCADVGSERDWSLDGLVSKLQHLSATDAFDDDCSLVRLTFD